MPETRLDAILTATRDRVAGLRAQGGTLEDVFLHLTGREYRE